MNFAQISGSSSWQPPKIYGQTGGSSSWFSFELWEVIGPSFAVPQRKFVRDLPKIEVTLNGNPVPVCAGSITLNRNEPIEWRVVLDDWEGEYRPAGGLYSSKIIGLPEDRWRIKITQGLQTWSSPELIQDDYSIDFKDGRPVVSGGDLSLLLQGDQQQ